VTRAPPVVTRPGVGEDRLRPAYRTVWNFSGGPDDQERIWASFLIDGGYKAVYRGLPIMGVEILGYYSRTT